MKYKITSVITFELDTEADHPKEDAIQLLDSLLPHDFEFSISGISHVKPSPRVILGEFPIDDVLPFATKEFSRKEYKVGENAYSVRMNSTRYWVFKNSLNCAACGLEGKKFLLEFSKGSKDPDTPPHFNLYGEENGQLVMLTKDHILAVSKGGSSEIESGNLATLCSVCNMLKANHPLNYEQVRELRQMYKQRRRGLSLVALNKLLADTRERMLKIKFTS